jgi:hypothetical protein
MYQEKNATWNNKIKNMSSHQDIFQNIALALSPHTDLTNQCFS